MPGLKVQSCAVVALSFLALSFWWGASDANDKYSFPKIIGTEEWKQLTRQERVILTTVPEDILSNMSTEDLVELCLQHPDRGGLLAADIPSRGLDYYIKTVNCFGALETRGDAAAALVSKYEELGSFSAPADEDIHVKANRVLNLAFLATMLSRDRVVEGLSASGKERLLRYCANQFGLQQILPSRATTGFLMVRVLRSLGSIDEFTKVEEGGAFLEFASGRQPYSAEYDSLIMEFTTAYLGNRAQGRN